MKQKIRSRVPVFGGWTSIGHASITEILCRTGLDFIGIDLEHSTISQGESQRIIAAVQAAGSLCLPRVASHNGEQIRRLLDSGADGVIVPMVNTRAQVEQIIDWCKYTPVGKRSYGISRAQGYGFDFDSYTKTWNERSVVIIQIESIQAVEAAQDLISHEIVDGVMIGPYDLSGSLGIPGQLHHPGVTEACSHVIELCKKFGKGCGTQDIDPSPDSVAKALAAGYTFIVLASDVFLLWKWSERMKGLIQKFR